MTVYDRTQHAAVRTNDYVFCQLIPYIGNKRRLLGLIKKSLEHTQKPGGSVFLDIFAGSGAVSRMAKTMGYRIIANDWEPYTRPINTCHVMCNQAPPFKSLGGYESAIDKLNNLPGRVDWVTKHLCPRDDENYDVSVDRMFYMRKNGRRIDAIRHHIKQWHDDSIIDDIEEACLLSPLLYQACYTSNTSGVFKGFHKGWGGQTQTALYRIASDLQLSPIVFFDNHQQNSVIQKDAQALAEEMSGDETDIVYLDPPYNQHPYGSNYHVLNSITLWDKPKISKQITRGTKSAIRTDWRTERRSAYNSRAEAHEAYKKLINSVNAHYILTSYSTDGTIPLEDMLQSNIDRGHVQIEMSSYKRYRVSSQRFSNKPMNVEFVLVLDTHGKSDTSVDELLEMIRDTEKISLLNHSEYQS